MTRVFVEQPQALPGSAIQVEMEIQVNLGSEEFGKICKQDTIEEGFENLLPTAKIPKKSFDHIFLSNEKNTRYLYKIEEEKK